MRLEVIQNEWDKDSVIDESELGHEAATIPQTHNKYLKWLVAEKLGLLKLRKDLAKLRHDKLEFYRDGPTDETNAKGWIFPSRGRLAPKLAETYVDVDEHVVQMTLEIGFQEEKVWYLTEIVKSLTNRNFMITNAIADRKWKEGN